MIPTPPEETPPLIRRSVAALEGYVPGEQPSGQTLIKLNTNENPYPPPPKVQQALQAFAVDGLRRYPDPSCLALREKLASYHGASADQVLVGNGSDEVLALCLRAFVEREGSVGYFDPSYSLYPVLAAIEDVSTRPVALGPDFEWAMPAGYEASLFFLANPNAPTGLLFSKHDVRAFCEVFPGVVLIDEAYVDFAREDCVDLALSLPNVLVARTLSKSFSLAGLRLGYAVGSTALIAALHKIRDSYNVSALSQALAEAALDDVGAVRENIGRIRATREKTAEDLGARGFSVTPSDANFLWVRPPDGGAKELFAALRQENILVRYFPGPRTGEHLRITIGTDGQMAQFVEALDRIARA